MVDRRGEYGLDGSYPRLGLLERSWHDGSP